MQHIILLWPKELSKFSTNKYLDMVRIFSIDLNCAAVQFILNMVEKWNLPGLKNVLVWYMPNCQSQRSLWCITKTCNTIIIELQAGLVFAGLTIGGLIFVTKTWYSRIFSSIIHSLMLVFCYKDWFFSLYFVNLRLFLIWINNFLV